MKFVLPLHGSFLLLYGHVRCLHSRIHHRRHCQRAGEPLHPSCPTMYRNCTPSSQLPCINYSACTNSRLASTTLVVMAASNASLTQWRKCFLWSAISFITIGTSTYPMLNMGFTAPSAQPRSLPPNEVHLACSPPPLLTVFHRSYDDPNRSRDRDQLAYCDLTHEHRERAYELAR